jgi:hypothetical protein
MVQHVPVGENLSGGMSGRRVTMPQAAAELGLTVETIRKRVQRGTLHSDKGPDGRRYLHLDESHPEVQVERSPVEAEMRDRLRFVERQLEAERQAHTEARRIIARLVERVPALEPSSEPRGAPETPPEAQEPAEPRPWLGRVFGR